MLSGPTSAKNPILLTFVILASITSPLNCGERAGTYGLEHNGLVPAAELGETRAGHDLALPDIQDRDDLDDIALEVSMRHVRICRSRSLPRHLGACDSLGQLWATYETPPWTDQRTTDAARCGDRDFSGHKCAANVRGRTWSSRSVSRRPRRGAAPLRLMPRDSLHEGSEAAASASSAADEVRAWCVLSTDDRETMVAL